MRPVLNELLRRTSPCTSYPFASKNSARYDPSCPVMPVISARFMTTAPSPVMDRLAGASAPAGELASGHLAAPKAPYARPARVRSVEQSDDVLQKLLAREGLF